MKDYQLQYHREIERFVKWSHKASDFNLINCSSGNLSHKIQNDIVLVSQSKKWLGELKKKNVVILELITGKIIHGQTPTGELPMHLSVLRENPSINTVFHFQSPSATTLSCRMDHNIDYNVIIEVPIYLGEVKHLPYLQPGSIELANAVLEATKTAHVIQLSNHGQIITGSNYREVIQRAVFFELACSIILNNDFKNSILTPFQIESLKGYR
ncbi:MAG TPA: class II aldolase/adducin family protein [Lentimicrobium sp.]|nr:class II aldolase/adducin family protein [Lentimicrobium sp.]